MTPSPCQARHIAHLSVDPSATSTLVDLSKVIEKVQIAIIGEVMRLHPEEFTQLPNGNWIPNARAINR